MPDAISFLPEDLRKKEEALRQQPKPQPPAAGELKFSIPKEEQEDIEVIEIDEGEVEQVLANEPLIARLIYKATSLFDEVRAKLFSTQGEEPAPKLPPQFFSPPPAKAPGVATTAPVKPGMASAPAAVGSVIAGAAPVAGASKARIMPMAGAPRRVRVIRRVRKPVRVSFVSSEDLRLMHIDLPKRRFTLVALSIMFFALMGGGWFLLDTRRSASLESKRQAEAQLADVRTQIQNRQKTWNDFQDLEPRLKALSGLLATHISPTHLLELIEERTLPTVSYSSFSMTADGRVQLAVSADSLTSAARQLRSFETSGFVSSMEAGSYTVAYENDSLTPKSVQFQLNVLLKPDILRMAASKPIAAAQ